MIRFIADEAKNVHWKYLNPVSYGRLLKQAVFWGSEEKYVRLSFGRVPQQDLIIDRPPKKGSLHFNDKVIMPVEYKYDNNNRFVAVCAPKLDQFYFNATVISRQNTMYLVKAIFKRKLVLVYRSVGEPVCSPSVHWLVCLLVYLSPYDQMSVL